MVSGYNWSHTALSTMRTAGHKLVEIGSVAYLYLNFDVRSMSVRKKFHVSVIVSKNNGLKKACNSTDGRALPNIFFSQSSIVFS